MDIEQNCGAVIELFIASWNAHKSSINWLRSNHEKPQPHLMSSVFFVLNLYFSTGLSDMCENDAECIVANGDENVTICNSAKRCQCAPKYVQKGPNLCLSHSK